MTWKGERSNIIQELSDDQDEALAVDRLAARLDCAVGVVANSR